MFVQIVVQIFVQIVVQILFRFVFESTEMEQISESSRCAAAMQHAFCLAPLQSKLCANDMCGRYVRMICAEDMCE